MKKISSKLFFPACFVVLASLLVSLFYLSPLIIKERFLKNQNQVGLAVDLGDFDAVSPKFLQSLDHLGVHYVVLPVEETAAKEQLIRLGGASILWRADFLTPNLFQTFSQHVRSGDGVLPSEAGVFGYPGHLYKVGERLKTVSGFVCVTEFNFNKGIGVLRSRTPIKAVKTHVLHLEETLSPAPFLWRQRLLRAVRERKVQLLLIRLSPAWTEKEKLEFLSSVTSDLTKSGYALGSVGDRNVPWPTQRKASALKTVLTLLLAGLAPVAALLFVLNLFPQKPILSYGLMGVLSVTAGLAVHALSFHPDALTGLAEFRGVKIALLIPFVISFFVLVPLSEIKACLDRPLTFRTVAWILAIGGLGGGMLIIRSGNFPLLPVSDHERVFRDSLEILFGARPRFKEFLIGQPLLLWGLHRWKNKSEWGEPKITDSFLLMGGLLAPVSIINTFCHLHIPLQWGILRTFHGVWLGALVYFSVRALLRLCKGRIRL